MSFLVTMLFCAAVVLCPWPLAGNWPFARTIFLVGGQIALLLAIVSPGKTTPQQLPRIWIPLLLGVVFVGFQASSLSGPIHGLFTANATAAGQTGAEDILANLPDNRSVSVYPAASRAELVDLLLAVVWFLAASQLLRDRKSIRNLLVAITGIGVGMSVFGIIQNLTWNGKLFWYLDLLSGGQPFGSFVNRNNAAGFLVVTFSAALFFLAFMLFKRLKPLTPEGLILSGSDWQRDSRQGRKWFDSLVGMVAELQPKHLYAISALIIIFAGVCASVSRGGMLALACVTLLGGALLFRANRWLTLVGLFALLAASAAFIFYTEQTGAISQRVETLYDLETASASRLRHWGNAWPFAVNNSVLGVGAGTYRYVSPLFQSFFFERVYAHAENVYLETLVELGILGICLLITVAGLAIYSSIVLLRRREPFDRALGITGLGSLLGLGVASIFDFGIYQPANSILAAVLIGAVVGRAELYGTANGVTEPGGQVQVTRATWTQRLFLLAALAMGCWATYESVGIESLRSGRLALNAVNTRQNANSRHASDSSLAKIERNLERAISIRPDDADAHFELGEYYLTRYRIDVARATTESVLKELKAADERFDDNNEPGLSDLREIGFTEAAIWKSTTVSAIHQQARLAQRRNNKTAFAELVQQEPVKQWLTAARAEYILSEEICPLTPRTMFRQAQLAVLFETDEDREAEYIDAALSRTFGSRQLSFDCGLLSLSSGNPSKAIELWKQCLRNPYARAWQGPIVEFAKTELPMKALFEEILPQNPENLLLVTLRYFSEPDMAIPRDLLLIHTRRVIEDDPSLSSAQRLYLLGEADRLNENHAGAVENYRLALKDDPDQPDWRFKYAENLYKVGEFDEAIRQLKICELSEGHFQPRIKPLLSRIRRDRAKR